MDQKGNQIDSITLGGVMLNWSL